MMSRLVPKLRFKEFSGEWDKKPINKILTIGSGKDYKHLSSGDIPVYGTGGYMLSVNDYLYDGESVCIGRKGTIDKPMLLTGKFWTVDTLFYTHSFKNNIPKFIYALFLKINWYKYNEASGVPSLSKVTIGKIDIFIPTPKEQQKIASCLSSLDSLIEAQNKKVSALKQHKKGLMQQLFPAEGEREPKLRFKAFSGEWEKKEVHNVFAILAGGDVPKNELSDKKTQEYNIPILSNGIDEKSLYGWTNKAKIYKPSLTVSARGTIGWTSLQENPFFPIVRLIVLTPKIEINLIYAYYYMKNIENDYKYAKVGIPQLTKPMIKNIKLVSPKNPKEQQKIASCLSSLDALIKAQNKKVEALKKHKTGLMQQMFVSGEV